MGRIKEIVDGWSNHLFGNKSIEDIAKKRMSICKKCPENSFNKKEKFTLRIDEHCTLCGCTLSAKTKSPDSECPLLKWKSVKIK